MYILRLNLFTLAGIVYESLYVGELGAEVSKVDCWDRKCTQPIDRLNSYFWPFTSLFAVIMASGRSGGRCWWDYFLVIRMPQVLTKSQATHHLLGILSRCWIIVLVDLQLMMWRGAKRSDSRWVENLNGLNQVNTLLLVFDVWDLLLSMPPYGQVNSRIYNHNHDVQVQTYNMQNFWFSTQKDCQHQHFQSFWGIGSRI